MELTLRYEEIGEAIRSLEMYISMHLGQYDRINTMYRFYSGEANYDRVVAGEAERNVRFLYIRNTLMPELQKYSLVEANRGIFQSITDPRARDAYDVSQVIHYALEQFRESEGQTTIRFGSPLFSGRYPHPEGKASRDDEGEVITLSLCREQLKIMVEAAEVYLHLQRGEIGQAFTIFTDSQAVFHEAGYLDEKIMGLVEQRAIDRCSSLLDTLKAAKDNDGSEQMKESRRKQCDN